MTHSIKRILIIAAALAVILVATAAGWLFTQTRPHPGVLAGDGSATPSGVGDPGRHPQRPALHHHAPQRHPQHSHPDAGHPRRGAAHP